MFYLNYLGKIFKVSKPFSKCCKGKVFQIEDVNEACSCSFPEKRGMISGMDHDQLNIFVMLVSCSYSTFCRALILSSLTAHFVNLPHRQDSHARAFFWNSLI